MAKPHKFAWNGLDAETSLPIETVANMAQRAALESTGDLLKGKHRIVSVKSTDRAIEFRINDFLISFNKLLVFTLTFTERGGRTYASTSIDWYTTTQTTVGGFIPVSAKTMVAHHTFMQFVRNLAGQIHAADPTARVTIREGVQTAAAPAESSTSVGASVPPPPSGVSTAARVGSPPPPAPPGFSSAASLGAPVPPPPPPSTGPASVPPPPPPFTGSASVPPPPPPVAPVAAPPVVAPVTAPPPTPSSAAVPPPPPTPSSVAVPPPPASVTAPPPPHPASIVPPSAPTPHTPLPGGGLVTAVPGIPARVPPLPPAGVDPVAARLFADDEDLESTRLTQATGTGRAWSIVFDDGRRLTIDAAPVVLGRGPSAPASHPTAVAVAVDDPHKSVSKTHALLAIGDGMLWVTDLHSTNGTKVTNAVGEATSCPAGVAIPVGDGHAVSIGEFTFRARLGE